MLTSLIKKGKYTLFMSLIERGVFFLIFVYLAHHSDAKEYGLILSAFAFANILNAFFEMGFGAYIQREVAVNPITAKVQLKNIVTVKTIAIFLFFLITIFYYSISKISITIEIILITTLIYITGFGSLFSKYLYGLNKYEESFFALMKSRLIIPVGLGIILLFHLPSYVVFLFLLIAISVQTFTLYQCIAVDGSKISFQLNKEILISILQSSLPMGIGVAFVWVYDKMDVLFIGHIIGIEMVAFYSVAYSLYKLPIIFSGVILTPLYSDLSNNYTRQKRINLYELWKPILALVLSSVGILIVYNSIPEILLKVVYGRQYVQSAWMLGMLAFALPALYLNNFTGVILNSIRREKKAMQSAFWALIVNIGLNILLLPTIGIIGAVIATISTEYSILIIQCFYLKQSKSIFWEKTI